MQLSFERSQSGYVLVAYELEQFVQLFGGFRHDEEIIDGGGSKRQARLKGG